MSKADGADSRQVKAIPLKTEGTELSTGAVITLTHQNTTQSGNWACAAVWSRSSCDFVLASVSKSTTSRPPALKCRTGSIAGTPGIVLTVAWLDDVPTEFAVEVCVLHAGAKEYDTIQKWSPDQ